jgi:hypothetical protein
MPRDEASYALPHRAFVDTTRVDEGVAEVEERVVELWLRTVEVEEACNPEQVPNSALHPVPQCPVVLPHHPYWLAAC